MSFVSDPDHKSKEQNKYIASLVEKSKGKSLVFVMESKGVRNVVFQKNIRRIGFLWSASTKNYIKLNALV